jgi:hypothetical protein
VSGRATSRAVVSRRRRRTIVHHAAVALLVLAVLEIAAYAWTTRRAPRFEDYGALAALVAEIHLEGDGVIVSPRWAEPMVRRALGDDRFPLADVAPPDLGSYPTLVEVSLLGAAAPEAEGWRELERRARGPFVVRRLENPESRGSGVHGYDFVSALSPQAVEVEVADGRRCMWNPQATVVSGGLGGHPTFAPERFDCGGPFFHVGVTVIADENFRPRRCLWAHPPASGELVIRYRDVPLGARIVGHAGLQWIVERERSGAPVELVVRVAGQELARVIHADGDGWSRFEVDLGSHQKSRAEVVFAVSTPDYRHRHFCFEARSE